MVDHFGVSGVMGSLAFAIKAEAWYTERWPATENIPLPDPDPDKGRRN
jgi:hypothetical protein